jgi:hypothetical protein
MLDAVSTWLIGASETLAALFAQLTALKIGVLVSAIWASVQMVMTMLEFSWPTMRRHGMRYHTFQLAFAVGALLIIVELSSAALLMLSQIDLTFAFAVLAVIIVLLAGAYIWNDLRDNETFNPGKLLSLVILPLLPVGGTSAYSAATRTRFFEWLGAALF